MATDLSSLINVQQYLPHIPIKWIMWGFVSIIVLLLGYRLYLPKTYPILIGVKRKVGNGTVKYFDNAILKKIDGVKQLYVYGLNRYWPIPENKYFYPCRSGLFKKWYIDMYLDSNDELVPNEFKTIPIPRPEQSMIHKIVSIPGKISKDIRRVIVGPQPIRGTEDKAPAVMLNDDEYVATLIPKRREMELWGQLQRKRVAERANNDFMSKYGFIVGQGMVVILIIGVTLVMMNKQVEIAKIIGAGQAQALTVLQALKGG